VSCHNFRYCGSTCLEGLKENYCNNFSQGNCYPQLSSLCKLERNAI